MNSTNSRERCILYFNHGTKCLPRLLTSIYSLRRFPALHHTPIIVADTSVTDRRHIEDPIAKAFGVEFRYIELSQHRRHSAYVTKSRLWRATQRYKTTLYLDADTIITSGDLDELFNLAGEGRFVATRFSDWVTTGKIYSKRIRQWSKVECPELSPLTPQDLVDRTLANPYPGINTGVMAWGWSGSEVASFMIDWELLTHAGWRCSFTDELAAQILLHHPDHADNVTVLPSTYNQSALYPHDVENTRIFHCHGKKHLSRPQNRKIWLPVFEECWRENVANIREWAADVGDKSLREYLAGEGRLAA